MGEIEKLTEYFKRFPGIGPRQAKRFVYHLLRQNTSDVKRFTDEVLDLKNNVKICTDSFCHFYSNNPSQTLSPIARDPNRDRSILMIVETDTDMDNIEKQGVFNGKYFVLGGVVEALAKEPEKKIRSNELLASLDKRANEGLNEIIIALSANPDGDNTYDYLLSILAPYKKKHGIKITSLGRGLSTGTELEYIDEGTMRSAFLNRQ